MRVPVINVHCAICGTATVLPIRVDNRMTAESLKEAVFHAYHTFCRDEGVKFLPSSSNPHDYAVYSANEQGLQTSTTPFRSGKTSGETVRDQLVSLPQPYFAVLLIGQAFLERDNILQDEGLERNVLIDKRLKLMQSLQYLEQVSCEKAIEMQLFRERQENAVSRVEDVMLYGFVAYQRYLAKVDHESAFLRQMDVVWRTKCIPWIQATMESVATQKRMYLASSGLVVKSTRASVDPSGCLTPLL